MMSKRFRELCVETAAIVGLIAGVAVPAQAADQLFTGDIYFEALSGQVPSFTKPPITHTIMTTGMHPLTLSATQPAVTQMGTQVDASPPISMGILALTEGYTLSSGTGTLMAGGGFPGGTTLHPPSTGGFPGAEVSRHGTAFVSNTPGGSLYGGTLRYFLTWASHVTLTLGGGQQLDGTFRLVNQAGRTLTNVGTDYFYFLTSMGMQTGSPAPVRVSINNWRWTTGMVTAIQTGGNNITTLTLTGYDNRSSGNPLGTVSLVSPSFWASHGTLNNEGADIHRLTLPEPGQLSALGAGALALFAVYGYRRRRDRSA